MKELLMLLLIVTALQRVSNASEPELSKAITAKDSFGCSIEVLPTSDECVALVKFRLTSESTVKVTVADVEGGASQELVNGSELIGEYCLLYRAVSEYALTHSVFSMEARDKNGNIIYRNVVQPVKHYQQKNQSAEKR